MKKRRAKRKPADIRARVCGAAAIHEAFFYCGKRFGHREYSSAHSYAKHKPKRSGACRGEFFRDVTRSVLKTKNGK